MLEVVFVLPNVRLNLNEADLLWHFFLFCSFGATAENERMVFIYAHLSFAEHTDQPMLAPNQKKEEESLQRRKRKKYIKKI